MSSFTSTSIGPELPDSKSKTVELRSTDSRGWLSLHYKD